MADAEALARWRQWARDAGAVAPGEVMNDDDLRYFVIHEQEQRAIRLLSALHLYPEPEKESVHG